MDVNSGKSGVIDEDRSCTTTNQPVLLDSLYVSSFMNLVYCQKDLLKFQGSQMLPEVRGSLSKETCREDRESSRPVNSGETFHIITPTV